MTQRRTNKGKSSVHAMAERAHFAAKIASLETQIMRAPDHKAAATMRIELARLKRLWT